MTDYDDFAPDSIVEDNNDDPFAEPPSNAEADDPFGAAAPVDSNDDPFAASSTEPAGDVGQWEAEPAFDAAPAEQFEDAFGLEQDAPVSLEAAQPQDDVLPESAILGQWQSERAEVLRQRRDKAREKQEDTIAKAKEEFAQFKAERAERIEKIKAKNRADEQNYAQAALSGGSTWEKVNKLVNMQPKPSDKPGSSKVERLSALLIQLKHSS